MQTFKIVLTILVALLLQLVLSNYFRFFRYVDLPLLVTVYVSLQRAPMLGMVTGCLAGIGGDIVGGGILGIGGFSKTLIGYTIAIISIRFSLENALVRVGIAGLGSAANTVLFVSLNLMLDQSVPAADSWGMFGRAVGWKAIGDSAVSIVAFLILDRVFSEQVQSGRMAIKKRFYD